jgi:hypothetical protein
LHEVRDLIRGLTEELVIAFGGEQLGDTPLPLLEGLSDNLKDPFGFSDRFRRQTRVEGRDDPEAQAIEVLLRHGPLGVDRRRPAAAGGVGAGSQELAGGGCGEPGLGRGKKGCRPS